ncbi:DUF4349 domain-containing protein [Flavitalea flava]
MPTPFRKRLFRLSLWMVSLFVVLFLFRLLYGFYGMRTDETGFASQSGGDFFGMLQNQRKNYASEKFSNTYSNGPSTPPSQTGSASSQKYEKTATVQSKTLHFEEDEALIRKTAAAFNAPIQYEQGQGKKGNRELYLSIGITPSSFDTLYLAVQKIGLLRSTTITKTDKTNEYRQLNAKKASLEKILGSLNDLKNKGGAISDFVELNEKILEKETLLQELGVDLGNYNTENEFCTLRFSLFEGTPGTKIGLFYRVKIALEWSLKYYAVTMIALVCVVIAAFFLLQVLDKLKVISAVTGKLKD